MIIEEKTNYTKLTPSEGYHISNVNRTETYEGFIYLGKYDSVENYIEVTKEDYEEWKRLQEVSSK